MEDFKNNSKWFALTISKIKGHDEYQLYNLRTGTIIFIYSIDRCDSIDEFTPIKNDLIGICKQMTEDEPFSYDKYINPLFRDLAISRILN